MAPVAVMLNLRGSCTGGTFMEIANVGDPRLVAEQLTARHQLVL